VDDQHAPVIGIAMDGFKLHARLNPDGSSSDDLDACRGQASAIIIMQTIGC